jgi:hypothetical protein
LGYRLAGTNVPDGRISGASVDTSSKEPTFRRP